MGEPPQVVPATHSSLLYADGMGNKDFYSFPGQGKYSGRRLRAEFHFTVENFKVTSRCTGL